MPADRKNQAEAQADPQPATVGTVDAIAQNAREQRAGLADAGAPRPAAGDQRSHEDERLEPGQRTGGTGGAGAPIETDKPAPPAR